MRGPLSAAILSLEFLSRELKRQRATRDMLEASEDALTSSTNVANMITQILDTTKLEEGRITLNLVPVPVRELLDPARQQVLSRAQSKSITVDVDAPDNLFVAADQRLFPRLLDNLLSNALRYSPGTDASCWWGPRVEERSCCRSTILVTSSRSPIGRRSSPNSSRAKPRPTACSAGAWACTSAVWWSRPTAAALPWRMWSAGHFLCHPLAG